MGRSIGQGREIRLTPYLYIVPALVIYAVFYLWPVVQLVILSLEKWSGLGNASFVGLHNYVRLITADPIFWVAFLHNVLWLAGALVIPLFIGLVLAILLVRAPLKGRTFFRTVYFLPQVLSSVAVAVVWHWIYDPTSGALNAMLDGIGLPFLAIDWLGNALTALPSLFVAWSWVYYGFCMVIFIAALQGIGEEYFEAAKLEGARWLQQLRLVILPAISRPMGTVMIITTIISIQVFDLVYVITSGGPGHATDVVSLYMYFNAFQYSEVGYGSAIAVVLALITLFSSVILIVVRGDFRTSK